MKTPLTDAFCDKEGLAFIGDDVLGRSIKLARRLETDRARLIEALRDAMAPETTRTEEQFIAMMERSRALLKELEQ